MKLSRLQLVHHKPQVHPRNYSSFSLRPLTGAIGAEISGVDLASFNSENIEEIKAALTDHLFLVFHDQRLKPESLLKLAQEFGQPAPHEFWAGMEGAAEVFELKTEPDAEMAYGSIWHTDLTCNQKPPKGNLLYCVDAPKVGGDTLFSNMYLAFENLSPSLKNILRDLKAEHRSQFVVHPKERSAIKDGQEDQAKISSRYEHPVIIKHPETDANVLYVNRVFTEKFSGMTLEESHPLLEYLFAHAIRPEFTGRVSWKKGTLCMWDNISTQHHAVGDYRGMARTMWRVTLEGTTPRS